MIKIIFFDIDGTLIPFGTTKIQKPVLDALNKLKQKGIKLFIATGRPNYAIPKFDGITFDGAISFNGQYCFDQNGDIFHNPLNKEDVIQLIKNCNEINEPVCLASNVKLGCNFKKEMLDKYFTDNAQTCPVLDDFDTHLHQPIYQAMVGVSEQYDQQILKNTKHLSITRWWSNACDIIPSVGGKNLGIQKVLEHYHFDIHESMAFGDGGNDKSMLQYVGIGIAMGNADNDVKEIADYTTLSVEEDGIVHALSHLNIL